MASIEFEIYCDGCAKPLEASLTNGAVYVCECNSCRKKAVAAARDEGIEEGRQVGYEEGRQVGYEEGLDEGRQEGKREGVS